MPTDNLKRTAEQSIEAKCATGTVAVTVGDTFFRDSLGDGWAVAGFGRRFHDRVVMCKPVRRCPGWAKQYEEADGTVAFCEDTVAAYMLTKADGAPRDARGYKLKSKTSS